MPSDYFECDVVLPKNIYTGQKIKIQLPTDRRHTFQIQVPVID